MVLTKKFRIKFNTLININKHNIKKLIKLNKNIRNRIQFIRINKIILIKIMENKDFLFNLWQEILCSNKLSIKKQKRI